VDELPLVLAAPEPELGLNRAPYAVALLVPTDALDDEVTMLDVDARTLPRVNLALVAPPPLPPAVTTTTLTAVTRPHSATPIALILAH